MGGLALMRASFYNCRAPRALFLIFSMQRASLPVGTARFDFNSLIIVLLEKSSKKQGNHKDTKDTEI